jgi:hypothetical protein
MSIFQAEFGSIAAYQITASILKTPAALSHTIYTTFQSQVRFLRRRRLSEISGGIFRI